jgi:tRNA U34 5-methylaminomethyl-2-thiouridine-forming methyltransferase MnmC
VIEALEARMGPRERLVNRLARAAGAAERREVLSDTTAPLDAQTVAALRQAAADAGELGADDVRRNLEAAASDLETRISTTQEAGR